MFRMMMIGLVVLIAAGASADHHEEPSPDDAIMAAMAKASTPGAAHRQLEESVGEYTAEMAFFMGPDTEPMVSSMTVTRTMELEGRVLLEHWEGTAMGAPFKGVGRTGYDNVTNEYWSTWTDNFSTGVLVMRGTFDEVQSAIVLTGSAPNPMTGKLYSMRSVMTYPTDNTETMDMYEDHGDGEYRSMSVTLTRKPD